MAACVGNVRPSGDFSLTNIRSVVALAIFLLIPFSASAACPTAAPSYYVQVTYAGANCSSTFYGTTCAIAQPVELTAAWAGFGDPIQACDAITWNYGDGTSETKPPGVMTTTHSYASAGSYPVSLTMTNSLGTRTFFYSASPTIAVANGYFQLSDSCCSNPTAAEGSPVSFTVQRTNGTGTASVQYATLDQSALAGVNYVPSSGTLTFAPGEIQKTISVPTIDDGIVRSTLTFRMTLSNPTGGFLLRNADLNAQITDADPRPVVGFETAASSVSEGAGTLDIRVTRTVGTNSTVSALYQIQNNSSNRGTVNSSGVLTFFAGETVKTITVPILQTTTYDGDRVFTIFLSSLTNGAMFGQYGSTTITVKDEQPEPVVVFGNLSVLEGSGTSSVNVSMTLSNPAGFDITVRPSLTNGTARLFRDFNYAQNTTFTIPAGQTTAAFPVQILGNTTIETNKNFGIGGTASRTECCNFTAIRTQPGTGIILNDDAGITPSRISIAAGTIGSITAEFGAVPPSPQTVTLSSSDPSVASVAGSVTTTAAAAPIDVIARTAGMATITATLPAAYGGGTFTTDVYVFDGAALVLSPATVSIPVGGIATISASFSPALKTAETVVLKAGGDGTVSVTDHIVIDPAQVSTFTVKGLTRGTVYLKATLGSSQNNAVSFVRIDITSPATTPAITQLVPANGPSAGGTNVTVNGANLRADCTVRFGGVPASNVAFVSANAITVTTPPFVAGPADVSLSCGSDSFVLTSGFTYLAAAPTLSNVTPSFGSTSGGTLVKITGTNIGSGCWPFFDNIAVSTAVVKSSTEITASVPPHASPSTVALALRCPGGATASLANAFTYSIAPESSPVITNVDPLIGSAGKSVTISGARFRFDDRVTFDSTSATVLETSPETHVVRIPELPLGKTSITVTDAGNHASTTGPIFMIVEPQPPQITTVSPSTTRPGNEATLEGSGFRPGYSFSIGGLQSALVSLSYTRVVIRIPQLAPGAYPINVLNSAPAIASVGPSITILKAGLAITGATPACVRTDGGGQMTITGTGFAAGAVVTFDGTIAAGATVIDAQTINVTLPTLAAGTPRIGVTNANGETASFSNAFSATSPFAPDSCSPRSRSIRH